MFGSHDPLREWQQAGQRRTRELLPTLRCSGEGKLFRLRSTPAQPRRGPLRRRRHHRCGNPTAAVNGGVPGARGVGRPAPWRSRLDHIPITRGLRRAHPSRIAAAASCEGGRAAAGARPPWARRPARLLAAVREGRPGTSCGRGWTGAAKRHASAWARRRPAWHGGLISPTSI
jgi:hypothetical protein